MSEQCTHKTNPRQHPSARASLKEALVLVQQARGLIEPERGQPFEMERSLDLDAVHVAEESVARLAEVAHG